MQVCTYGSLSFRFVDFEAIATVLDTPLSSTAVKISSSMFFVKIVLPTLPSGAAPGISQAG